MFLGLCPLANGSPGADELTLKSDLTRDKGTITEAYPPIPRSDNVIISDASK